MFKLFSKETKETVDVIDLANKINHNTYQCKRKFLGITYSTYSYTLHSKISDPLAASKNPVGFNNQNK